MNNLDLNMRLLKNKPIFIKDVGYLYQLTLDEIEEIDILEGWLKFYQYLRLLCISTEDIKEILNAKDIEIYPFEYLILICRESKECLDLIINGLSLFFKEKVFFSKPKGLFFLGKESDQRFITQENYKEIQFILQKQSCIDNEPEFKPKNDRAKQMVDRIKEMRNKYFNGKKQQEDSENDLSDIMSSVCSKHPSVNYFNVGQLSLYQLINHFKRLNAIDQYFINIESLRNGASKDEVQLKHWSLKLD